MTERSKRLILVLFLLGFLVVIPLIAIVTWGPSAKPVSGSAAVVLDIEGEMLEYHPTFTAGLFFGKREMTLTDALACINEAARDQRVKGLVLKIYPSGAGVAKCEEIAQAVDRFRKSHKPVIAFSPVLEGHHYLIACAADSIFMPPAGYLIIPGPASSAVFVRGALDKLGIRPNIHRIEDYKSAAEMFTEKERTNKSRAMTERLLGGIFEHYVADMAAGRRCSEDAVLSWIDRGLYSPERALDSGIIDGVRYWDEIEASFEDKGVELVEARDYLRDARAAGLAGPHIAIVHAQGLITMGESGYDPMNGLTMGSETIIEALRAVREDDNVKAVILRVDSPGGDGLAGNMISREVELTAKEKPVVVSMCDVAASGGYEISYRADQIVAMPGTITGSIGSITGKMNARGLYNKLGITKDEIGTGRNSLINSDYQDFSPEEWDLVKEEHWAFYRSWIEEIAGFREMSVDSVDSLGRGRVWTGEEAAANGLIDGVADLNGAVGVACELAGIADSSRAALVHYPRRVSIFQEILSRNFLEDAVSYAIHEALVRERAGWGGLFLRHVAGDETIR
ncbi:MAG TPA: signal peptide peptidase SppA [Candidatus Bathyarchaeia archaeon]|nr:signal peptide peptidase SppA [Candidatus Bathyarchaeia archaeon]